MALSATFTANFSSFYDAVEKADVKLKDFGAGADKVGGRLTRMADQFSGVKIVQEATIMAKAVEEIGGVSKLTEKELSKLGATANEAVAKMKLLGMDVPKNLQQIADKTKGAGAATSDWAGSLTKVAASMGIAFSVGAIKDFIGSVFDAAGAVKDLSDQWGVGTTAVQQWSAAAKLSGVEAEQVGKSVQFLTQGLAEGSDAYVALLANVGLSADKLKAMPLEDAYKEVIKAIGGIKDEALQLDVAQGLLGKSSKQMIGAIRDGFLEAADAQRAMSEETIKRLEAAGDAWEQFKNNVIIWSGEMLGSMMKDLSKAGSGWSKFFGDVQATVLGGLEGHRVYMEGLAAAEAAAAKGIEKTAAVAVTSTVKSTAAATEAARKRTAAHAKERAEADKLETAYQSWKRGMIGMSDESKRLTDNLIRLAREGYTAVVLKTFQITNQLPALTKQTVIQGKALEKMADAAETAGLKLKALAAVQIKADWAAILGPGVALNPAGAQAAADQRAKDRAATIAQVEKLRITFGLAGEAMAIMARAAGGAFGNVMRYASGAADMVFQYILATKAAKLANDTLAASAAAASLAMGVATMGVSIIVGGIVSMNQQAAAVASRARDNLKQLRAEFQLTAAEVKTIQKALQPSGTTILGSQSDMGSLITMLTAAKDAIAGLSGVTERFGGVVPKALRPMLESLMAMQGLPAALRDQMAAFAGAPAWQTIQQRAEDLGIEFGALGGAFNQKRLADMGFGFFHDLEMFLEQGADLDGVLRGMSDELSTLAAEAVKTGSVLPKSLEPYMKRLRDMGLLVDENGNAIEDLTFADLEDESLKAVVAVLEQIRELLEKALPEAVGTFIGSLPTAGRRGAGSGSGAFATVDEGSVTGARAPGGGGNMTVIVEADGRQLSRLIAPYVPGEVRRFGLARG